MATAAGVYAALQPVQVGRGLRIILAASGVAVVVLLGAFLWYLWHQQDTPLEELKGPALVLAVTWLVAALGLLTALRWPGPDGRLGVLVASAAVALIGIVPVYQTVANHRDVGPLLPAALKPPRPGAGWILAQYKCYNQAFNFYTRSRVLVIGDAGELRLGLNEPDAGTWFRAGEQTIDELSERGPLALIVHDYDYAEIARRHHLTRWAVNRDRGLLFNDAGLKLLSQTARVRGLP